MKLIERQLNRTVLMTEKENRIKRFERELDIIIFYSMARKYGFVTPIYKDE